VLIDGYIRVSQVGGRHGERFISPQVQRDQIRGWAKLNHASVGEIFEELDESGARRDRPKLLAALERVESGASNGIVVAKLDRFGRSLGDSLAAIERLQAAGGTFVSVQDGLDLSTATGKLVLRIMFSMAEWELDRIRTNWETAKRKAIERGVFVGSWPPFGYRRDQNGRLKPDRRTAPVLADLFRQRAAGASICLLARSLEARGFRTVRGNRGWSESSLRHILANRVYLGEVRAGSVVKTNAHEPLVTQIVWQGAQSPRVLPEQKPHAPTLLGGILRCAGCSMALHSGTVTRAGGERQSEYGCHARSGAGECSSAACIAGGLIEPYIERAFFSRLRSEQRSSGRSSRRLRSLTQKANEAEAALIAYRDHPRLAKLIGDDRFEKGLAKRLDVRDDAMQLVTQEARRIQSTGLPEASALEDEWPRMSVEERRKALGEVIDCVFVWRGRDSVIARTHICYRGQAPPNLPRVGSKRANQRPIGRDQLATEPAIAPPSRWTKARIRRDLEDFLSERDAWPSPNVFCREGRGPLLARVMRTGGPGAWAQRLGINYPQGRTLVAAWSRDDARAALAGLLRGRRTFPSRQEMLDGGHASLYAWLRKNGGVDIWAAEFEVAMPRPGPPRSECA
jgi:DNA invertase Pin-like site-specific DNA recombinase